MSHELSHPRSDPQLVEPVQVRPTMRHPARFGEITTAGYRSEPLEKGDDWRTTGARNELRYTV